MKEPRKNIGDIEDGFIYNGSFEVKIPASYIHEEAIESFLERNEKKLDYVNENIDDYAFSKVTHRLKHGKIYTVDRYLITNQVVGENTGQACVNFIKKKKGMLVGAQGLLAAFEGNEEEFDKRMKTVCFDEEKALCEAYRTGLPSLFYNGNKWNINLVQFWSTNFAAFYCLLCFREKGKKDIE